MSTKIFVNLPVKDLDNSINFFTELGFSFNAQFTDENATCLIISDDIYAMLLVDELVDKTLAAGGTPGHFASDQGMRSPLPASMPAISASAVSGLITSER